MAPPPSRRRGKIADEASGSCAVVLRVDLEAEKATALLLSGDERGAGTGKGVEHEAMLRTEAVRCAVGFAAFEATVCVGRGPSKGDPCDATPALPRASRNSDRGAAVTSPAAAPR
jgi:hypothetical protein